MFTILCAYSLLNTLLTSVFLLLPTILIYEMLEFRVGPSLMFQLQKKAIYLFCFVFGIGLYSAYTLTSISGTFSAILELALFSLSGMLCLSNNQ